MFRLAVIFYMGIVNTKAGKVSIEHIMEGFTWDTKELCLCFCL